MVALRRLTALVTMLVTLVLVLTESGFACSTGDMAGMGTGAASGSAASGSVATGDMAGMPMSGSDHGRAPAQVPCRFPWAPTGCRDMAPCAPAALAVAASPAAAPMPAHDAVVVVRVRAPRSVETPPEPPPPRA